MDDVSELQYSPSGARKSLSKVCVTQAEQSKWWTSSSVWLCSDLANCTLSTNTTSNNRYSTRVSAPLRFLFITPSASIRVTYPFHKRCQARSNSSGSGWFFKKNTALSFSNLTLLPISQRFNWCPGIQLFADFNSEHSADIKRSIDFWGQI